MGERKDGKPAAALPQQAACGYSEDETGRVPAANFAMYVDLKKGIDPFAYVLELIDVFNTEMEKIKMTSVS